MTKTDFAELKEKLTKFNRKELNLYLKKCLDGGSGFTFEEESMILLGAEMKFKESAAIISELIEIIQSQSEALEEITGQHSDLCQTMKPVRPSYVCHAEIAEQALSETNTRLQKLREGK